jgi:hypothetical protein
MTVSVASYRNYWWCELREKPRPVRVPPRAWRQYFPAEASRINNLEVIHETQITIDGLTTLAGQLSNNQQDNRTLFVATMMWGRGPKNGRLMPKFLLAADHPDLDATLQTTRERILAGQPGDAYRVWIESGVSGIREPFFTKWFFVCGLDTARAGLQPFTLDGRVRNSLKAIGWPDSEETPGLRGQSAQFYDAYLRALVTWAEQLSEPGLAVSPLQVEQFLFRKNGAVPLTPR